MSELEGKSRGINRDTRERRQAERGRVFESELRENEYNRTLIDLDLINHKFSMELR